MINKLKLKIENRPRRTPPSGELNTRVVAEYSDCGAIESRRRCKMGVKLLLIIIAYELSIATKFGDL